MTKSLNTKRWIFTIVHILLNIAPLAVYTILAFVESTAVHQKLALSSTLVVILIMSLISWVNQITFRSKTWVLILGLYMCLQNILTPLIVIGCCQILDEIVVCPLKNYYKEKYKINKEIDKRL